MSTIKDLLEAKKPGTYFDLTFKLATSKRKGRK